LHKGKGIEVFFMSYFGNIKFNEGARRSYEGGGRSLEPS